MCACIKSAVMPQQCTLVVCVCVRESLNQPDTIFSQTRCGQTLGRTAFVFGLFEMSILLVRTCVKCSAVSRDLDLFV